MLSRSSSRVVLPTLLLTACGGPGADGGSGSVDESAEVPADQRIRTADPYARGYTDADFPRVRALAPNVYSYEQLRSAGDERFTTVSMFVVTDEGVLVADGQGSYEETERMLGHIAEVTDQPVTTVVVASDHGDHTAGNAAFPADVELLAHPTSAAALEAARARQDPDAPPLPTATTLVDDRTLLRLGDTEIEVHFLGRAHTGGDLVVYLPREKVMFMSEAYLHRVFPAMRSAYPSEWVEMIERAQAMDVEIFVPGHGFVDHPTILADELERFQDALRTVIAESRRLHGLGLSLEEARAQASWGELEEWSLRSSQGDRALQQVYAEIDGTLPGGAP